MAHALDGRNVRWGFVAGASLLFCVQLGTYLAYGIQGEPGYHELSTLVPPGSPGRLIVDLSPDTRSDGEWRIPLPETWLSPPEQRRPPPIVLVFVDRERVPVHTSLPSASAYPGPHPGLLAYYLVPSARKLRLVCSPPSLCRAAVLFLPDDSVWKRIVVGRLRWLPRWQLLIGAVILGAVFFLTATGFSRVPSAGGLLFLGLTLGQFPWWTTSLYTTRWAAPLLYIEVLLLAFPSLRRVGVASLVSVSAALLCASLAFWNTVLPQLSFALWTDEGIYIHGAQRILRGEIPNKDFFSFIPPLSYATLAVVGLVRGAVLTVDARALAGFFCLSAAGVYAYVLRNRAWVPAWPPYACALAVEVYCERFAYSHHHVSIFFAALSLLPLSRSTQAGRYVSRVEAALSGFAASLALMTTSNLGAYVAVALSVWLLLDARLQATTGSTLRTLLCFWLSFASLPGFYVIWHLAQGNAVRLYRELVEFVFVNYAGVNAANLDYLFFYRKALALLRRSFLSPWDFALQLTLQWSIYFGHFLAVGIGVWALLRTRQVREGQRGFYRASVLISLFYLASLATSWTNPFTSNIRLHAMPAFVLMIAWAYTALAKRLQAKSVPSVLLEGGAAAMLGLWVLLLPNWRGHPELPLETPLGRLNYVGQEERRHDDGELMAYLASRPRAPTFVAFHFFASHWYSFFPTAQRLRFSVLVPTYSPTEHYQEALAALRRGELDYAIKDQSLEMYSSWDPRFAIKSLEETNGGPFYRYIEAHGRVVFSNRSYTVWGFAGEDPPEPGSKAQTDGVF